MSRYASRVRSYCYTLRYSWSVSPVWVLVALDLLDYFGFGVIVGTVEAEIARTATRAKVGNIPI